MKMSQHGKELLKQWEGSSSTVYRDVAGLPTIGVGHLLTKDELTSGKIRIDGAPVVYAGGLTDQQVFDLLSQDLQRPQNTVGTSVNVPLDQNQFDALVSFAFNVGSGAFSGSTLLKVLNAGQYNAVPAQLLRWVYAGGRVVQGMITRRQNEIKLWNGKI